MTKAKISRNDPCPCGSGKKYKQCCLKKDEAEAAAAAPPQSGGVIQELQRALTSHQAGHLAEAGAIYRLILAASPAQADALHLLGVLEDEQGNHDDAVALISKALKHIPHFAEAHNNLGVALQNLGRYAEAVAAHQKAVELSPGLASAHYNLGNALRRDGKSRDAIASYRKALVLNPNYPEACSNLGVAMQQVGQLDEAIASFRQAIALRPGYAEAYYNLGNAQQQQGATEQAIASYQEALRLDPTLASAYGGLSLCYQWQGRMAEAVECINASLRINQDNAETYNLLGNTQKDQGRTEEAIRSYQHALKLRPDYATAYSNLLFLKSYSAVSDAGEYLESARSWEHACIPTAQRLAARRRKFKRAPASGRKLRIGYVSGDFRQHAVTYFIEQVFARHDRNRIELFAYSTNPYRDAVTARIESSVDHYLAAAELGPDALRERIDADGIDVLIDLSGHTAHNRLEVFARRAAPVQVHYLGYFASTGLTEMDYWIADDVLAPPSLDVDFSEKVWRLPRVWVSYDGKDAPPSAWKPSIDGSITLGSFNNLGKLTPATMALWSRLLQAMPDARLLLKSKELAATDNQQRIRDAFSQQGVAAERIELQAASHWADYMACHDQMDIALDPVGGHGGGTSSCDALWMGVPLMHLEGSHVGSRFATSILTALGHPEWISRSEDEYIARTVALARDVDLRRKLRAQQRDRMAASLLCDAGDLARQLEDAYFAMFQNWAARHLR